MSFAAFAAQTRTIHTSYRLMIPSRVMNVSFSCLA